MPKTNISLQACNRSSDVLRTTTIVTNTSNQIGSGYSGAVISAPYRNHQVADLPLLPLTRVVMPGGRLPLRVIEPREIDMVRECLKNQSSFGVCLITNDKEIDSTPATVFPYGTLVKITDWDTDDNNLLIIVTQGVQKFRTINTTVNPNGMLLGDVELLPPPQDITMPAQYSDLADLLRQAMQNLGPLVDYTAADFKESVWMSNRLIEALPMSPKARHALMIIESPIEQLHALQKFINNWQV